jgi:hypothetical protein
LGLWPITYVSERSDELQLHWHDVDNCGYVIEGSSGERMVRIVGVSKPANLMEALLPSVSLPSDVVLAPR